MEEFDSFVVLAGDISCVIAAFGCLWLASVILKEHTPLVWLQRFSLCTLSLALFANAIAYYPDWSLIFGHRPTGSLLNIAVTANVLVMVLRGHVIYQPSLRARRG